MDGGVRGTQPAAGVPAALPPELLSSVLDAVPVATLVLDPTGAVLACNALAESLLRLPPDWAGLSILEGQDPTFVRAVGRLLAGDPVARETRVRLGDGGWRSLSWKASPLVAADGTRVGAVAIVEDTSSRQAARRDAALLDALFREAPVGLTVYDAERRVTRVNRSMEQIDGRPGGEIAGRRMPELLPVLGDTLDAVLGRVLATGEPAPDVELTGTAPGTTGEGERTWVHSLFRLEHGGQVVGAGDVVRDVTDQRAAERERAAAAGRLAFTVAAGEQLAASLETEAVLDVLCRLAVPAVADHVVVDLLEDSGRLRRRASRHTGVPPAGRPSGALADYPEGHPVEVAARTGRPWLLVDAVAGLGAVPEGADREFVRTQGVTSVLVLPMLVARRVVGVVSLLFSASGRHYDEAEAALARDLVSRAAVAVSNALSYEQQRSAAVALQLGLLPKVLRSVEGLDVAWRYLPGATGTQVGGDWADVLPLPSGRTAVVVGDVMGRGLRAAAVMGQVRTALRVLAHQDPPPAEVLRALDVAVADLAEGQLVTCAYAVFDPARSSLRIASAGHVPPVLVRPEGVPVVLGAEQGLPVGVPLGVRAGLGYEDVEVPLPAGAGLALYTDGLVESPGQDIDAGIAGLVAALGERAWDDLEETCERALAAGVPHVPGHPDDVALLLVRATGTPPGSVVTLRLPPDPAAVAPARAAFAEALRRWGLHDDDAATVGELLVSEVVTNAIRYARGEVGLTVRLGERAVHVEVEDADTRIPRLRHATLEDEGGRGLALVQALARSWGARPLPAGKVVWFALGLGGGSA
ncbi:PAS domain S-box-containing protein [Motilibacter rhizosphaerae]|uniref:protein-serine/threonine phosphatase n=1 Tax=Motilibacter rhizosphaerae TaxID=598652 RepID=A0A4Q7NSQ1_9ACTN|nr:SpoIIE family protein phosphatase [Motilibacter rhizosphaerae]RZS90004.1 PAS domain S-box-containing protein [Motilibacter rhizosphaerae]